MTEQLYRWVKASDRNPPSHPDIKHNVRYIKGNGWGKDLKGVAKYVGRWIDDAHGSIDDKDIEWLEPIPSLNAGSLEEAKKFCADFIAENDKCSLWEIFEQGMRFAGASRPSLDADKIVDAEKVLDFLLTESDLQEIDMVDGDFYWREDKDGDQPLGPKDIIELYQKELLNQSK